MCSMSPYPRQPYLCHWSNRHRPSSVCSKRCRNAWLLPLVHRPHLNVSMMWTMCDASIHDPALVQLKSSNRLNHSHSNRNCSTHSNQNCTVFPLNVSNPCEMFPMHCHRLCRPFHWTTERRMSIDDDWCRPIELMNVKTHFLVWPFQSYFTLSTFKKLKNETFSLFIRSVIAGYFTVSLSCLNVKKAKCWRASYPRSFYHGLFFTFSLKFFFVFFISDNNCFFSAEVIHSISLVFFVFHEKKKIIFHNFVRPFDAYAHLNGRIDDISAGWNKFI